MDFKFRVEGIERKYPSVEVFPTSVGGKVIDPVYLLGNVCA